MPEFLLQGRPPVRCFGIAVVLSNNSLISIALVATLAGSAFIHCDFATTETPGVYPTEKFLPKF
jgi:hypothetical protein